MADDPSAPDVSFTVARHGYDRAQVRAYVHELFERAQRADADRNEARQQAAEFQGELEIARREVVALSERLDAIGTPDTESTESSARLIDVAKSQASEITTRARAAADGSWAAAEKASSELRERYRKMLAELDDQHAEIHATHKEIIAAARTQAEELTTVAERRRRELDSGAERDRVRIDREFSESMNAKRSSLERELTHRREACVAEVEKKLREADEQAKARLETVTDQVKRLTEVRAELSERLRGTQELLARSVDLLEPAESEAELARENPFPMPEPPGTVTPGTGSLPAATSSATASSPAAAKSPEPATEKNEPVQPATDKAVPADPATAKALAKVDPPTQVSMPAVRRTKLMPTVEPTDEPATEPPTVPATAPAEKPDATAESAESDKSWKPEPPNRGNGKRVPPQRSRRSHPAKR